MTDPREIPLRRESDLRGRCCPRGVGCNVRYQACWMMAVEMQSDRDAVRHVRYWWRRWRSLPWWRLVARREALGKAREWRDKAYESVTAPPPPMGKLVPLRPQR